VAVLAGLVALIVVRIAYRNGRKISLAKQGQ
jgi:hypothetical protein